jgi:hypothetical protein
MLDKQGYMNAHVHAPGHSQARARTHKFIILIAFQWQQCFANAPQYYVIRPLPVILNNTFLITLVSPVGVGAISETEND